MSDEREVQKALGTLPKWESSLEYSITIKIPAKYVTKALSNLDARRRTRTFLEIDGVAINWFTSDIFDKIELEDILHQINMELQRVIPKIVSVKKVKK